MIKKFCKANVLQCLCRIPGQEVASEACSLPYLMCAAAGQRAHLDLGCFAMFAVSAGTGKSSVQMHAKLQ